VIFMAKKEMRNSNRVSKANNTKKVIIAIAILTTIVLGYYYLSPQEGASNLLDVKKIESKYTQLSRNPTPYQGKVVATEFMSFYCDHCYELEKRMPAILKKYGERLQIIYKPIVWGGQSTNSVEAYIQLSQTYFVDETPSIIVNNILKVTPHNTEDNIDLMAQNLDTIIGSIIKQS